MPPTRRRKARRARPAPRPAPVYRDTARCKLCLKVYVVRPGPGAGRPRDFCKQGHATLWWRFHHPRRFDAQAGADAAARWRVAHRLGKAPPPELEGPEPPGIHLPEGPDPERLTETVIARLAREAEAAAVETEEPERPEARCPLCRESLGGRCGAHLAVKPFG